MGLGTNLQFGYFPWYFMVIWAAGPSAPLQVQTTDSGSADLTEHVGDGSLMQTLDALPRQCAGLREVVASERAAAEMTPPRACGGHASMRVRVAGMRRACGGPSARRDPRCVGHAPW